MKFQGRVSKAVGVIVFLSLTIPALSVPVEGLQFYPLGGDMFAGNSTSGNFYIDDYSDTGNVGQLGVYGYNWEDYEIRDGAVWLDPSARISDLSYLGSSSWNPRVAYGFFEGGGTFSITGSITTKDGEDVLFTGTILEATVKEDFYVKEEEDMDGIINAQLQLEITGGELKTGAVTGFVLSKDIIMDVAFNFCTQFGHGDVRDFQSAISYMAPSPILINPVEPAPEPTSIALFLGSMLLMYKRSRSIRA